MAADAAFASLETQVVNGVAFHLVLGGDMAGWSVAAGDGVQTLDGGVVPTARD